MISIAIMTSMGTTAMALPFFNGDGLLLVITACAVNWGRNKKKVGRPNKKESPARDYNLS